MRSNPLKKAVITFCYHRFYNNGKYKFLIEICRFSISGQSKKGVTHLEPDKSSLKIHQVMQTRHN